MIRAAGFLGLDSVSMLTSGAARGLDFIRDWAVFETDAEFPSSTVATRLAAQTSSK